MCSNLSQIVSINESLLSVIISSLIRTYSAFSAPSDEGSQERGETYLCSNSSQITPINESLLSERFSTLRTYFDLLVPSAKRAFPLSRLPLMRELPSVSEAEGEKETLRLPLSRLRRQLP